MKKTLLAFSALSMLAIGSASAQTTYFPVENFNSVTAPALPTNWTSSPASIWKTGAPNTVMPALTQIGYNANTSDHMAAVGIDGTVAANSGAMLVTPTITLPAGATSAGISFDMVFFANGTSATNVETLQVMSSTDGGTTWTAVSTLTGGFWSSKTVTVGNLAGQSNIKFGIKYTHSTATGYSLGAVLDNIKVWMYTDSKLINVTTGDPKLGNTIYLQPNVAPKLSGYVQNVGTASATPSVYYQIGNGTVVGPLATTPASVAPLGYATYTSAALPALAGNATSNVKVWITAAGDADHTNDTMSVTLSAPSTRPAKKLVFEEATGTWCGWCPRGTVNMENFANSNAGVAAQIAVHNEDPMTITAYDSYIGQFISGFPSIVSDRDYVGDPGDISSIYTAKQNDFGFADVTMAAPTVSGNNVSVAVTVKPSIDIPNPNLALVITESNIQSTTGTASADSAWYQHNYYAGGGQGVMGGFETKGTYVVGTKFHFVARSITGANGTTTTPSGSRPSTWPTTLVAGTTYTATLTAPLSASWVASNLQYIVMLNDSVSGSALNSAFSPLPTLLPTFTTTAISNVVAGIANAVLYPNPTVDLAYLQVDLKDAVKGTISVTDATGRVVTEAVSKQLQAGKNVVEVSTASLSNGLYFVNFATEKGNISLKLQVAK